jgi:hypothetical protein
MAYFPIFAPYEGDEPYKPEHPMSKVVFEKRYSERRTHGYKIRHWKRDFLLLDSFDAAVHPTTWRKATVYAVGQYVFPTTPNGYVYLCAVAGTSHATTEPTWSETSETEQADNTVTWVCFENDQIQAVMDFVDARHGGVEKFKVWMSPVQAWVEVTLPEEGFDFIPVESGYYGAIKCTIPFKEEY